MPQILSMGDHNSQSTQSTGPVAAKLSAGDQQAGAPWRKT